MTHGMKFALTQSAVIGFGFGTQGQEAGEQSGIFAAFALLEQATDVIGIFNILVASVVARMLRDKFLASVNCEGFGFDPQFEQGSGVFEGHGITVGFEGDTATVGSTYTAAAADIIAGQWQGLEGWLFLFEGVAGALARLAMEPHVSHLLHPAARLGVECFQGTDFQTIEEVLLNVADGVFHAPFLVSPPDITGHRFEAVVRSKIQVTGIEDRSVAGDAVQYRGLKIIVHGAPSTCAEVFQRVAVGGQEAFHTLAQVKLHKEQAAVTEQRSEVMELAQAVPDAHQTMGSPVNLHAIARFEGQFEERLVTHRTHRGNEVMKDGSAAGVTVFGT